MSYDVMVFAAEAAPRERALLPDWCRRQLEWAEGRSYDDPAQSTPALRALFTELIQWFPPLNGPLAPAGDDDEAGPGTDYALSPHLIQASFPWEHADDARQLVQTLAIRHGLGFYDVSADESHYPPGA